MDLNKLKDSDPIKRFVDKESSEELSPMDPPDAYSPPAIDEISYEEMNNTLKKFIDEHKICLAKLDAFEGVLNKIKTDGFGAIKEVKSSLADFFQFVDNNISKHNIKEEKFLFPLLHQRYIDSGEHSNVPEKKNAVDILEDDHIKFMQIAAITFTLFGLAGRLPDPPSRLIVLDLALEQGKNLVEMLRLHIFREDKIVFPFAQKNLTDDEFKVINEKLETFLQE
ncbi:MAG: hypothetical protein Kow0098_12640 [Ignavibacteriaceae bacterium]